jgi:hypothetical protein
MGDLTENSPGVRLYAAMSLTSTEHIVDLIKQDRNRLTGKMVSRLAAEHERIVTERTAELEARVKVLENKVKAARMAALKEAHDLAEVERFLACHNDCVHQALGCILVRDAIAAIIEQEEADAKI